MFRRRLYSVQFRKVLYLVLLIIITDFLKFGYLKIRFLERPRNAQFKTNRKWK